MKNSNILVNFLYFFLLVSCSNNEQNNRTTPITPTVIGYGELYGNGEENISQQNTIITNSTDWNNLKAQMNTVNNATTGFNETGIDFETCKIIATFDQIRSNGGYTIDNSTITENTDNIIVTIHQTSPSEVATTVITQPFKIIRIPISPKPIIFN
jgi:hypothetical protein